MKRIVITPALLLAAMIQLNGAAGRTSALWSAARTGGLLRPTGQVFTASRAGLPQRFACPAGSRLLSVGSPVTASRLSGRFGALAKTPTPSESQGGYWSRFKGFFAPTGAAIAAGGAYAASRDMGEEESSSWLYRLPAGSEEEEMAKSYLINEANRARNTEALDQAFEESSKKAFMTLRKRLPHTDYNDFKTDYDIRSFRLRPDDVQRAFKVSELEEDAAKIWRQAAENKYNIDDPVKRLDYLKAAEARYHAAQQVHDSWQKFMDVKSSGHEPASHHIDQQTGRHNITVPILSPEEIRAGYAELNEARDAHKNAVDAYNKANEKLLAILKSL